MVPMSYRGSVSNKGCSPWSLINNFLFHRGPMNGCHACTHTEINKNRSHLEIGGGGGRIPFKHVQFILPERDGCINHKPV